MRTEVRVALSFASTEAFLVIVAQELVQEVNGFVRDIPLVLRRDKSCPRPLGVTLVGGPSVARRVEE